MASQPQRIVLTGLGVVTPLGSTIQPVMAAIRDGRTAYGPLIEPDCTTWPVRVGGWIPELPPTELGLFHNKLRNMGKYVKIGVVAAMQALQDAGLRSENLTPERTGAFIATGTHGHNAEGLFPAFAEARGGDELDRLDLHLLGTDGLDRVHPWWLLSTISNNLIFFVTHFLNIKGPNTNTCNSAVAGAYALERALESLRAGEIDVALVGGADSPVNWQLMSDFSTLGFLAEGAPEEVLPARPYSAASRGAILADGAAFLVLETEERALRRGAVPKACVGSVALFGGFRDPIRPAADGSDMGQILQDLQAGASGDAAMQISTAGIGHPDWDGPESAALREWAGDRSLACGSAKAWLGHTYSASFLLETAVAATALAEGTAIGFPTPPDTLPGKILRGGAPFPHTRALVLGQCFGGNTAGVMLHGV